MLVNIDNLIGIALKRGYKDVKVNYNGECYRVTVNDGKLFALLYDDYCCVNIALTSDEIRSLGDGKIYDKIIYRTETIEYYPIQGTLDIDSTVSKLVKIITDRNKDYTSIFIIREPEYTELFLDGSKIASVTNGCITTSLKLTQNERKLLFKGI